MKQFISMLVAAVFAAASVTAIAQEKKAEGKDKAGQMDKKDGKKAAKKSSKKSDGKKTQKKGEGAKKDEMKK